MSKKKKDRKVYVIDCETDPFLFGREPKPFIWGCFDGETFQTFEDAESLLQELFDKRAVVFAHNGGRFDFLFLQDYFTPYSAIRIINGRIASFKINDCLFRDSFLVLPTALKTYKKDKIDYSIFERGVRNRPENMAQILKYLEGDCRYLHELVSGFELPTERVLPWPRPRYHFSEKWTAGRKSQKHLGYFMNGLSLFTMEGGSHVSKREFIEAK